MPVNEQHPVLSKEEMADIAHYREMFAYKTPEQTETLLYDLVRAGKVSRREHSLLCRYVYQGY